METIYQISQGQAIFNNVVYLSESEDNLNKIYHLNFKLEKNDQNINNIKKDFKKIKFTDVEISTNGDYVEVHIEINPPKYLPPHFSIIDN